MFNLYFYVKIQSCFVNQMDPLNVTLILVLPTNKLNYLYIKDGQAYYKSNNDIIISDKIILMDNYQLFLHADLAKKLTSGCNSFYLHDGSQHEGICFVATMLSFLIDVLMIDYANFFSDNIKNDYCKLTKNLKANLVTNTLYLSIVGKAKHTFKDLLTRDELSSYESEAFSVAEIHNKENLKFIFELTMNNLPDNCTEIIYTFSFKYFNVCPLNQTTVSKFYQYRFIESRNLDFYVPKTPNVNREELLDTIVEDIEDLYQILKVSSKEMSCYIYENETSDSEKIEHVFRVIASQMKCETSAQVHKTLLNKIEDMRKALHFEKRRNYYLQNKYEKDIEDVKLYRAEKIVDKLSESQKLILTSQKKKYDEMIQRINSNHEKNLDSVTKFYETKICKLFNELQKSVPKQITDELLTDIEALKEKLKISEKDKNKLQDQINSFQGIVDQVQNILGSISSKETINRDQTLQLSQINASSNYCTLPIKQEIEMTEKLKIIKEHKLKLAGSNQKIEELMKEIKKKDELTEKLTYQFNYITYAKKKDEITIKHLTEENIELRKDIDNTKIRNNEQFEKYEKLLKKSQQEISLHRREAHKLREHLCSENYPPTPPITKFKIRKSVSTSDLSVEKQLHLSANESQSDLHLGSTTDELLKLKIQCGKICDFSTVSEENETKTYRQKMQSPGTKKSRGRPRKKQSAMK